MLYILFVINVNCINMMYLLVKLSTCTKLFNDSYNCQYRSVLAKIQKLYKYLQAENLQVMNNH